MPVLDELGWLQFERLCELVLEAETGVDPATWEGSADSVRQLVSFEPLSVSGQTLKPPVLVRCLWLRENGDSSPDRLQPAPDYGSVVTFVNRAADVAGGDVVFGAAELLEAIRRLPEVRLRLPSLLSVEAPLESQALERSTLDIEAARALADVFVPTPAWQRA